MANIIVFGATGYIGSPITEYLGQAGLHVTALVRDPSGGSAARQTKLAALRQAGVRLLEGSLDDTDQLAETLQSFDVVISFLQVDTEEEEMKLLEACKRAGTVKHLFPSWWGGEYPLKGPNANPIVANPMSRMAVKEVVLDAVRASGIPFTIVVNDLFQGWALPAFGTLTFPGTPTPKEATIYGDGNTPGYVTAEEDIAKVVARAVADPRTINKKLVIRPQAPTQNELVAAYEAATGHRLPRITVTNDEIEQRLKDTDGLTAFVHALHKSIWIDNINATPPEQLSSDEVVYAVDLYPDIKYVSAEDFYKRRA